MQDNKQKELWRPNVHQIIALAVMAGLVLTFFGVGLRYMLKSDVRVASAAPAKIAKSAQPSSVNTPPAGEEDPASADLTPNETPYPVTLAEDADAGRWLYDSAQFRLEIVREQPFSGVTATRAVFTPKDPSARLVTAFAEGTYGLNVHQRTSDIAASVDALFAINGDYCGYREDGIIVREGEVYRENPARDMLCQFEDGRLEVLPEEGADVQALLENGLLNTWSFGPVILKDGIIPEDYDSDVKKANPRTSVGQLADGSLVLVVVDGRQDGYSSGMTLEELSQYMKDSGCVVAYNLDGGMTSAMVFNGRVISRPCGTANKERPLSDIIYLPKAFD